MGEAFKTEVGVGIFGASISDEAWLEETLPLYKEAFPVIQQLIRSSQDPPMELQILPIQEALQLLPSVERRIKSIPNPESVEGREAKKEFLRALKDCVDGAKQGQRFLQDMAGGPGERAQLEGFVKRAARFRLVFSHSMFKDLVQGSEKHMRVVSAYFGEKPDVTAAARPPLVQLFLGGLDAAVPKKAAGGPYYELSITAMVAQYCYSMAATLGMAKSESGNALATMVWDRERLDEYWATAKSSTAAREAKFDSLDGVGLQKFFSWTAYPELYGPEGQQTILSNLNNPKVIERLATRRIPAEDAFKTWAACVAEGLAFGILHPHRTRHMLELDHAVVDSEHWAEMRKHGLAIPPKQDLYSLDEQVQDVLEGAQEFVGACYPELREPLGW